MPAIRREKVVAVVLLVLLLGGLGIIQAMFLREHRDALARTHAQIELRNAYARRVLAETLSRGLEERRSRMEAALTDPLIDANDLFLRRGDARLLPRRFRPSPEDGLASKMDEALRGAAPVALPEEAEERVRLAREVLTQLEAGDRPDIEASVRAYLGHRVRFLLPTEIDLPLTLSVARALHDWSTPDPSLMRSLLLDGSAPRSDGRTEGMMRSLLLRKERFSQRELEKLCAQLVELAKAYGIPSVDFEARMNEPEVRVPDVLVVPPGPAVDADLQWYFEASEGELRGHRFDVARVLGTVENELRSRSIIDDSDRLRPLEWSPPPNGTLRSVLSVPLELESLALRSEVPSAWRRLVTKSSLVAGTGVLAIAVFTLGLAWQRRERALIDLRSDFVSTVSHELRTPLASVRLLAETLERRLAGDDRAKDYPTRIVREIDGASFLVENILSFHRVDKGRWVLYPEAVDLVALFDGAVRDLGAQLGREVVFESAGERKLLQLDPELARLLVSNLVKNAIVYNDGNPVRIGLESRVVGAKLSFRVRDNGLGIDPAEQAVIFEEFRRGRQSGSARRAGSGLGLALVRRIAELHQGTVRLASSDATGSCFELEFPSGGIEAS